MTRGEDRFWKVMMLVSALGLLALVITGLWGFQP
jgi:hypothetical protein